jgi:hypothetical protein
MHAEYVYMHMCEKKNQISKNSMCTFIFFKISCSWSWNHALKKLQLSRNSKYEEPRESWLSIIFLHENDNGSMEKVTWLSPSSLKMMLVWTWLHANHDRCHGEMVWNEPYFTPLTYGLQKSYHKNCFRQQRYCHLATKATHGCLSRQHMCVYAG